MTLWDAVGLVGLVVFVMGVVFAFLGALIVLTERDVDRKLGRRR